MNTLAWRVKGFARIVTLIWALVVFLSLAGLFVTLPAAATDRGTFSGAVETIYPDWFKISFLELEDDLAEASEAGKRLILIFHQDGCPYCNALVERNLSQKDIKEKVQNHFDVVVLNMWGDREVITLDGGQFTEKSFAEALKVQFTPTLLVIDERGKTILRLNGYAPPVHFNAALDYAIAHKPGSESFNEFMQTRRVKAANSDKSSELQRQPYFEPNTEDVLVNIAKTQRPYAVVFAQRDCPNCATFHNTVLATPSTRDLVDNFPIIQFDMWSTEAIKLPDGSHSTARDWAKQLEVSYAPTIIFFNAQGNEVIRSDTYFRQFHTQSMIDYVKTAGWRHEKNFQRYISDRAERLQEAGINVDIWK